MSTRDDASLSGEEREAFARIEAQAIADDPSLGASWAWVAAHRLRGGAAWVGRMARRPWVAPTAIVIGVIAVVVGLAGPIVVAGVGLVLVVLGAVPVAEAVRRRAGLARSGRPPATDT